MATRALYLIGFRNAAAQCWHFTIFVPSGDDETKGTLINVVGTPMTGYALEFERNFIPGEDMRSKFMVPIGSIKQENIVDPLPGTGLSKDSTPNGNLEIIASQLQPPGINENFLAPVNDSTNRRCQEWTMDFVRRLVEVGYLDHSTIRIVQSRRDPPSHGIGLQALGQGRGQAV